MMASAIADVKEISDATFDAVVLRSQRPMLVDFGAPRCAPCRAMEQVVRALAVEYAGRADVVTLNYDQNPVVAGHYGVLGLPTFVLFRAGHEVARLVGLRSATVLRRLLDEALASQ